MRALTGFVLLLLLGACAVTPTRTSGPALDDAAFAPSSERIDADALFALSPEMDAYLHSDIGVARYKKDRQRALLSALFETGTPWLDYDDSVTRTASEAFAARSGNCLSLVLMTAAFAKRLDLGVRYQWVYSRKDWSRDEALEYLNTHVNLVLLEPGEPGSEGVLVDFAPPPPYELQHSRVIEEGTLVSMYMNNRAVELMAQGEFDRAYWWARAAIHEDPGFAAAVNTLAVLYKARGRLDLSEHALRWLLEGQPDDVVALQNLAQLLEAQGRNEEADKVVRRIKKLLPVEPFRYYELGQAALAQGRYQAAKEMFQKEMRRDASYDKLHASLALALYGLGEIGNAQAQMALALRYSTTSADRASYARMLEHLRTGERP